MRRANVLIVILLAVMALAACGDKDSPLREQVATTATATATTTTPKRSARDGCQPVAAPRPAEAAPRRPSGKRLDPKQIHVAVLRTNCGTIRVQLAEERAPKTVAAFAGLVRDRFYDDLTFHRIAKPGGNDYVVQGGDPLGTGNGGPGYSVVEKPSEKTRYVSGVVAMAKAADEAPGTSGSQFFIVTASAALLAPEYAVLGRVTSGKDVVRRIAAVPSDPVSEMPLDPVVIRSIRLESKG